jgi:hypothetical protein
MKAIKALGFLVAMTLACVSGAILGFASFYTAVKLALVIMGA